ncbi:MAG: hypothetical protein H7839_01650 [Magnetococcus sp. YQC-5]
MWWLKRRLAKKSLQARLRGQAMTIYDQLAKRTLDLTGGDQLGLPDDFALRFDVMVLLVAGVLRGMRQRGDAKELAQGLWEMTFEGFEESLRNRGVTDIRMAARMNKLLMQATGRRNAYLMAWDAGEVQVLREAVGRNVLNGADPQDSRVDILLEAVQGMEQEILASTGGHGA